MQDFLGRELAVGDTVAVTGPQAQTLVVGVIEVLFEQRAIVRYCNEWNDDPPQWRTMSCKSHSAVKVEGPEVTLKLLSFG